MAMFLMSSTLLLRNCSAAVAMEMSSPFDLDLRDAVHLHRHAFAV